jgi:hypothetical protein
MVHRFQLLQHDLDFLPIGSALRDEMEALEVISPSPDEASPNSNLGILHSGRRLIDVQTGRHLPNTCVA